MGPSRPQGSASLGDVLRFGKRVTRRRSGTWEGAVRLPNAHLGWRTSGRTGSALLPIPPATQRSRFAERSAPPEPGPTRGLEARHTGPRRRPPNCVVTPPGRNPTLPGKREARTVDSLREWGLGSLVDTRPIPFSRRDALSQAPALPRLTGVHSVHPNAAAAAPAAECSDSRCAPPTTDITSRPGPCTVRRSWRNTTEAADRWCLEQSHEIRAGRDVCGPVDHHELVPGLPIVRVRASATTRSRVTGQKFPNLPAPAQAHTRWGHELPVWREERALSARVSSVRGCRGVRPGYH